MCTQAEHDAGCSCADHGVEPETFLPGTEAAPGPLEPRGMTACAAAPLVQKVIA
jgi:hypothetical protein